MDIVPFANPDYVAGDILTLLFSLFLLGVLDFFLFYFVRRKAVIISVSVSEGLLLFGWLFGLWLLEVVCIAWIVIVCIAALVYNINDFRFLLANAFKGSNKIEFFRKKRKSVESEKIFDRESMYQKVFEAVNSMSHKKMGALITFMRHDNFFSPDKMGEVVRQPGVEINCPITAELIETIFYEGTRLHDGGIVIVEDKIARAAVFFEPYTKPLTGKYGARHQAALGISDHSDSVTIVVSEETGRVAIAFQGELIPVTPDSMARVFMDCMDSKEPKSE